MAQRRRTRDMVRRKVRIKDRRADSIRKGDILWSDLSGRLFVLEAIPVQVNAKGNLLAQSKFEDGAPTPWSKFDDSEDEDAPKVTAYQFIVRRQTDGTIHQLGAYAGRAMLKTVRSAD